MHQKKPKQKVNQSNVSKAVYYHRQKLNKDPTTPRNPEDLEIPADLLLYKDELFVVHDTGTGEASHNRLLNTEAFEFFRLFDALKSLVYVPPPDVREAFDEVIKAYARKEDGSPLFEDGSAENRFLKYFVETWIGVLARGTRPMFPVDLWNCYAMTLAGKAKTTNSLEAWHHALKYAMGTADGKRIRFWRWLGKLKQECSLQEAHLTSLQTGTPAKLKMDDQRICKQRRAIAGTYKVEEILSYVKRQALLSDMNC